MEHYKQLKFPLPIKSYFALGRGKRRREYANVSFALDIEVSSTFYDGKKLAFPYIWQIGVGGRAYYGRYWDECITFLKEISEYMKSIGKHVICLVHNFSYEFTFLSGFLEFEDIFAVDVSKPIKATYGNIEFRCSYAMTNYSLANLADNYTDTKKMVGDLDYNKLRYPETPLTDTEMGYCENDVLILNEYWDVIYEKYIAHSKKPWLPLTNTSKVRHYCKSKIKFKKKYLEAIDSMFPSQEHYEMLQKSFMGGYTHANANYTGIELNDVDSFDFTSSYPAVMLYATFPMSKYFEIDVEKYDEMKDDYHFIFDISFHGIESKNENNIISFSKCEKYDSKSTKIDNGRVISSKYIRMTITDLDYEQIKKFYDIETIAVNKIIASKKGKLPKFLIESLVEFYKAKTQLKGVEGKEDAYLNAKEMLNALFGMMVTSPVHDIITFHTKSFYDKNEQKYKKWTKESPDYSNDNNFLLFQWGVYVTAWARYNLLNAVHYLNEDLIYSDTDSCKLFNIDKHLKWFKKDNSRIRNEVENACKYYDINFEVMKGIGEWEWETKKKGAYKRFMTWGAKRYLADDEQTISGFPKKVVMDDGEKVFRLKHIADKRGVDVYDLFKPPMKLKPEECGKTVMTYFWNDEPFKYSYLYQGEKKCITIWSYVHAEPTTFKMTLSRDYSELIKKYCKKKMFHVKH